MTDHPPKTGLPVCPQCQGPTTWEGNPYRPFCSQRCKLVDLGAWFREEYRISRPLDREDESPPSTSVN